MSDIVSKEGRKACWDSRDLYWKCLDENEQSKEKCKSQLDAYEKNCSKTWIAHFEKRREYLKFRKVIDAGDKNLIEDFIKNEAKNSKKP